MCDLEIRGGCGVVILIAIFNDNSCLNKLIESVSWHSSVQ